MNQRRFWGAVVLMLVATVAILFAFGRSVWCPHGDWAVAVWQTDGAHLSQHLLDPYSFTHIEHGVLFFFALVWLLPKTSLSTRFVLALLLESAWEVVENSSWLIHTFRQDALAQGYVGDSIVNALSDIACCALGFWFAARTRWYWGVALLVVTEIVLYLTISDNLVRNILLPIWPKASPQ
jgi:hypothetical protein